MNELLKQLKETRDMIEELKAEIECDKNSYEFCVKQVNSLSQLILSGSDNEYARGKVDEYCARISKLLHRIAATEIELETCTERYGKLKRRINGVYGGHFKCDYGVNLVDIQELIPKNGIIHVVKF